MNSTVCPAVQYEIVFGAIWPTFSTSKAAVCHITSLVIQQYWYDLKHVVILRSFEAIMISALAALKAIPVVDKMDRVQWSGIVHCLVQVHNKLLHAPKGTK